MKNHYNDFNNKLKLNFYILYIIGFQSGPLKTPLFLDPPLSHAPVTQSGCAV